MSPVGDYQIVMYGVATIAATVGIAYGRRRSSSVPATDTGDANEACSPNDTPEKRAAVTTSEPSNSDVKRPTNSTDEEQARVVELASLPKSAEATTSSPPAITRTPSASNSTDTQSNQNIETRQIQSLSPVVSLPPAKRPSLKRKSMHDQSEDDNSFYGYPHNLESIYPPLKRSRTPSSDSEEKEHAAENATSNVPSRAPSPIQPLPKALPVMSQTTTDTNITIQSQSSDVSLAQEAAISDQNSETFAIPEPPRTPPPSKASFTTFSGTASPFAALSRTSTLFASQGSPLPKSYEKSAFASYQSQASPFQSPFPKTPSRMMGSGGFASFAGTASPFASVPKTHRSPQLGNSIWAAAKSTQDEDDRGAISESQASEHEGRRKRIKRRNSSEANSEDEYLSLYAQRENAAEIKAGKSKAKANDDDHAITAATCTNSDLAKELVQHVTGEEEEDVDAEIKGIKLFVNRGNKGFTGGVLGNIKVLSDKTTQSRRILFRREPLWQVSMNIRISKGMRCSFEAEENTLRVMVREFIEEKDAPREEWKDGLVVYALKPGRNASKRDFKEFAESLMEIVDSMSSQTQ